MFLADWPMVMFSRRRTRRSSTMRPPWMMPMRRILGFAPAAGDMSFRAAADCMAICSSSERRPVDAFHDPRKEILLQLLPVVVDARLLVEEERLGLLDLAFDSDVLGNPVDLLAARATLDLH